MPYFRTLGLILYLDLLNLGFNGRSIWLLRLLDLKIRWITKVLQFTLQLVSTGFDRHASAMKSERKQALLA